MSSSDRACVATRWRAVPARKQVAGERDGRRTRFDAGERAALDAARVEIRAKLVGAQRQNGGVDRQRGDAFGEPARDGQLVRVARDEDPAGGPVRAGEERAQERRDAGEGKRAVEVVERDDALAAARVLGQPRRERVPRLVRRERAPRAGGEGEMKAGRARIDRLGDRQRDVGEAAGIGRDAVDLLRRRAPRPARGSCRSRSARRAG